MADSSSAHAGTLVLLHSFYNAGVRLRDLQFFAELLDLAARKFGKIPS